MKKSFITSGPGWLYILCSTFYQLHRLYGDGVSSLLSAGKLLKIQARHRVALSGTRKLPCVSPHYKEMSVDCLKIFTLCSEL